MLAALLPVISGFVFRHVVLSGLGSVLLALNLPPEVSAQIVSLIQALGPVGGTALGLGLMLAALVWSYIQKAKGGTLEKKKDEAGL